MVFKIEKSRDLSKPFEGGGSNKAILAENISINGMQIHEHNIYVFKDKIENFVDLLKFYTFTVQFWVTLAIIFLAGTYKVDLFSLGYICAVFVFLWFGTDYYVKALRTIIKWWDFLLLYSVIVAISKVLFKILGCRIGEEISQEYCWSSNSLDLPCANPKYKSGFCNNLEEDPKYFCDAIAFVMIVVQRRIFLSYYFFNVISDTCTQAILASRFVFNKT